jgi:hypothetical protein
MLRNVSNESDFNQFQSEQIKTTSLDGKNADYTFFYFVDRLQTKD